MENITDENYIALICNGEFIDLSKTSLTIESIL